MIYPLPLIKQMSSRRISDYISSLGDLQSSVNKLSNVYRDEFSSINSKLKDLYEQIKLKLKKINDTPDLKSRAELILLLVNFLENSLKNLRMEFLAII